MNGYKAFYRDKEIEVYAETSYKAQQKAAEELGVKPKNQHQITIALCEKEGEQVVHAPLD